MLLGLLEELLIPELFLGITCDGVLGVTLAIDDEAGIKGDRWGLMGLAAAAVTVRAPLPKLSFDATRKIEFIESSELVREMDPNRSSVGRASTKAEGYNKQLEK